MEGEVGGGRVVSLMSGRGCLSADGGLVWAECCGGGRRMSVLDGYEILVRAID